MERRKIKEQKMAGPRGRYTKTGKRSQVLKRLLKIKSRTKRVRKLKSTMCENISKADNAKMNGEGGKALGKCSLEA